MRFYNAPVEEKIQHVTVVKVSDMLYTVKAAPNRKRTFAGESAWSDAMRYANDMLVANGYFEEMFYL